MNSWNDLTINEIKTVLAEKNIQYNKTEIKKKPQLVDLCESSLKRRDLKQALQQFNKISDSTDQHTRDPNAQVVVF